MSYIGLRSRSEKPDAPKEKPIRDFKPGEWFRRGADVGVRVDKGATIFYASREPAFFPTFVCGDLATPIPAPILEDEP